MPTDPQPWNPTVWIVGFALVLVLALAFSSVLLKPAGNRPLIGDRAIPSPGLIRDKLGSVGSVVLASGTNGGTDPAGLVKPLSIDLSALSETQSRPGAEFFHKLPATFFTPQSAEATRRAGSALQDLHAAYSGAGPIRRPSLPDAPGSDRGGK